MNPSRITIIVLNWNLRDATLACLASLERAQLHGAHVLVVDNGSRDGSVDAIRARFPAVEVLALPENRGYAGGNNAGIRLALERGAEGVLLLNNDTEVAPNFLPPLLAAMDSLPGTAVVSSSILRHDRPELLDCAYADVRFDRRHVVQLVGVNAVVGDGFAGRLEVPIAIGCSVLIRAEAFRTAGLFDEGYFAYHEDVDWCLRAAKWGYRMLYEPESRVYHRRSASTGRPRPTYRSPPRPAEPALPNAEPAPWNPVRAYLGARNTVRLLRAHATTREKRAFLAACVRELPLELLAVVFGREGWLVLGRWGWRDMLRDATAGRHAAGTARLARLAWLPYDLLIATPRDLWRAWRSGALEQVGAVVRGLRDGYLRRPLPLERLGLR
ncbi:MAG TPA: glycosyltransferase family 2 protein [Candidatus Limnocylindria bacterium]|nr:glycosyltransferase family 2 protein [Candidatus Limnocylindria bacterium]